MHKNRLVLVPCPVLNWGYLRTVSFPSPPDGSRQQSSITTKLRRCPAGEGRGAGDSCSPRFATASSLLANAFCVPRLTLSHRNLSGSAERYTRRTRSVPGERGRELSDVLKQPDDACFGGELQSNPKS